MRTLICEGCGCEFIDKSNNAMRCFCTTDCRKKTEQKRHMAGAPLRGVVPTKNMGAYTEMRVIMDLFKRGYEVYRAVSPSCTGDIVCETKEGLIKIDAVTGYANKNGTCHYGKTADKYKGIIIGAYFPASERVIYFLDGREIDLK